MVGAYFIDSRNIMQKGFKLKMAKDLIENIFTAT